MEWYVKSSSLKGYSCDAYKPKPKVIVTGCLDETTNKKVSSNGLALSVRS